MARREVKGHTKKGRTRAPIDSLHEAVDRELDASIQSCTREHTVRVKAIADAVNYGFMYPLSLYRRYVKDFPQTIVQTRYARERYLDIFGTADHDTLVAIILNDPRRYADSIGRYEGEAGIRRPTVHFERETLGYDGLVETPLKTAECALAKKSVLTIPGVPHRDINVFDGACGNMRIALGLEKFFNEIYSNGPGHFRIHAGDIVTPKLLPDRIGSSISFFRQDMNQMDALRENRYAVATSFGAYYINPAYLRPLQTLEAARILEAGGTLCIGSPNEHYDMRILPRVYLSIDPRLDPTIPKDQRQEKTDRLRRLIATSRFGASAWNLQRDYKKRPDMDVVDSTGLRRVLENLGMEISFFRTWGEGLNNCYFGILARVTPKTKEIIEPYAAFRRKGNLFYRPIL